MFEFPLLVPVLLAAIALLLASLRHSQRVQLESQYEFQQTLLSELQRLRGDISANQEGESPFESEVLKHLSDSLDRAVLLLTQIAETERAHLNEGLEQSKLSELELQFLLFEVWRGYLPNSNPKGVSESLDALRKRYFQSPQPISTPG